MNYVFEIEETLVRTVVVKANDFKSAEEIVKNKYLEEEIILTPENSYLNEYRIDYIREIKDGESYNDFHDFEEPAYL